MATKVLQKQIDKFYKETGYQLELKEGKPYYNDYLDLRYTEISELPDNLVVRGSLFLYGTKITELPDNLTVGGWLDLEMSKITKLPKNLVVGGYLYLDNTPITELPDSLVVGGGLYLRHTKITKLPNNIVVGGYLDLRHTNIVELPANLAVGGFLDLEYTKIAKLPDSLVVGGALSLRGTKIAKLPNNIVIGGSLFLEGTKITELPENLVVGSDIYGISNTSIRPTLSQEAKKKLQNLYKPLQWNAGGKTYIKVDDIFSVVDSHRGNVWKTHLIGEEETLYVVTDGEGHYAHGNTLKEAKADLIYKINDRDTSLYENLSLDDEVSFEDAIAMYRTITGACDAGTRGFVESRLPKPHKERYTIREVIDLTDGEYGNERLKEFFSVGNR